MPALMAPLEPGDVDEFCGVGDRCDESRAGEPRPLVVMGGSVDVGGACDRRAKGSAQDTECGGGHRREAPEEYVGSVVQIGPGGPEQHRASEEPQQVVCRDVPRRRHPGNGLLQGRAGDEDVLE